MIGKLPTEEEIKYMKEDLARFDNGDEMDEADFADRAPYYIETIIAMHARITHLQKCLK